MKVRTHEPGGMIHVYQTIEEDVPSPEESESISEAKPVTTELKQKAVEIVVLEKIIRAR